MTVGIGDRAPSFTLPADGGRQVSLDECLGRPVVLVFYPGDDTTMCTRQLVSYNDELAQFDALDAQVLGISPQDVDSHDRFSGKHGFRFPLLADTDKSVAAAYGVLGPLGFVRRSVFILDRAGIVRYAHRALAGVTYRPVRELVQALERIGG